MKSASFDCSGVFLATCSRDKTVWIWEMEDGEFECVSVLHGHGQDVKSVVWHPTDPLLMSCSYDDTIKIWEEAEDDWYCSETLTGHESTVWDVAFDRSGGRIASGSDDKTVMVWSKEEGKWRQSGTITGSHNRTVYSVDWSRVGPQYLATGAADDTVRVFSGDSPFVVLASAKHQGDVNCVRWNPKKENLLASCGDDKKIFIWRLRLKDD